MRSVHRTRCMYVHSMRYRRLPPESLVYLQCADISRRMHAHRTVSLACMLPGLHPTQWPSGTSPATAGSISSMCPSIRPRVCKAVARSASPLSIHPSILTSIHPSIHTYIHTTPPCHPLARSRALSLSLASPPPFPVPLTRPADVRGCEQKVHGLDVGLM